MVDACSFISRLPKAELHVHIEGTMEPELVFKLAQKNNIELPFTLEEAQSKRQHFEDLQDFLNQYYFACKVLVEEEDFYELAMEYFKRAVSNNIVLAEVFFDPQAHTSRGVSFSTLMNGLHRAGKDAEQMGLKAKWVMCFLRDFSEEDALNTIEQAVPYADKISGIGLDSAELGNPPRKFTRVFAEASTKGLCGPEGKWKVAHAGEEGDASNIIEAIHCLGVARIDHGIRCLSDPYLCRVLADCKVPLTVCPNSNDRLQVLNRHFGGKQVISELLEKGLCVTINSDDPAFFGGYINENFKTALSSLELNEEELRKTCVKLCRNSFEAAFLTEEERQSYIIALETADKI